MRTLFFTRHIFVKRVFVVNYTIRTCNLFLFTLGLEDLLNDLLFLNQESTHNSVADARSAAGTTIGTANVLLGLGYLSVLTGTESNNLYNVTVSILLH
jgi:hypothetical protein